VGGNRQKYFAHSIFEYFGMFLLFGATIVNFIYREENFVRK